MGELTRFVLIRPGQLRLPAFRFVLAFESSPLIVALLSARGTDDPRGAMERAATDFIGSAGFVERPEELPLFGGLDALDGRVADLAEARLSELEDHVDASFGQSAAALRIGTPFVQHRRRLIDSIIALNVLPRRGGILLERLSRLLRLLDLVNRTGLREAALEIPGAVQAVLSQVLVLPEGIFPLPPRTARLTAAQPDDVEEARQREIGVLRAREQSLRRALKALARMEAADFQDAPEPAPVRPDPAATPRPRGPRLVGPSLDRRARTSADVATRPDSSRAIYLLRPLAITRLDLDARTAVADAGIDLAATPLPEAARRVEHALTVAGERLAELSPSATSRRIVRVGTTFMPAGAGIPATGDIALPEGPRVPTTVGTVRIAGIGTLYLVRQHILRYLPGPIAHIESIMRSESKERTTRRLERTEETFVVETETTREEERDQQSTERFALERETTRTVEQSQSFNVGVSISAAYGPFFQVSANTAYSSATAQSESSRKAFSYAKETSERALSRLSERIRKEQTIRTIREYEENNRHGFDNTAGAAHVSAYFQWINEVQRAQVYDYGLRTLLDFMLPEPAALIIRAIESSVAETDGIEAPEPFTLRPDEITPQNYHRHVARYAARDVQPPPPLYVVVSRAYDDRAETVGADFTKSEFIDLQPGYSAWRADVVATFIGWTEIDGETVETQSIHVQVGRQHWRRELGDARQRSFVLDEERGTIPVSIATFYASSYAVNIEITCRRDDREIEKWQLATHAAIQDAYLKLQKDYEEKLAAAATREGVRIEGRNPLENRLIERTEIKRLSISLLTAQHFDLFGSVLESSGTLPRLDFDEAAAEGAYVRFFEQAFEWENMTYVFYGYFWGRRSQWLKRLNLREVDTVHAEFLKAGFCRAVVPVRPGFEAAIARYLDTGEIWEGGDPPQIGSPLYVDILDEIRARLQAPGDEVPVFEPWEVELPTSLVRIAPEGPLPAWQQNADGTWTAAPMGDGDPPP